MLDRRFISTSFEVFLSSLKRYRSLNESDKLKLLSQHALGEVSKEQLTKINEALDLSVAKADKTTSQSSSNLIENELNRLKHRSKSSRRFSVKDVSNKQNKFNMGLDHTKELEPFIIKSTLFSKENELSTLLSDVKRADYYGNVEKVLYENRPIPNYLITDKFIDVMARAIEENILRLERPALVNELSDFKSSYAMKRAALRNLLRNKCTRNAFEETRIDKVLDSLPDLRRYKFNAPLPPEIMEPLLSFRGDVRYSHSPIVRLDQKLDGINVLLDGIIRGDDEILSKLPEFLEVNDRYPFRNHYTFMSCIPNDVTGSIKMGRTNSTKIPVRYPNLQCVAHSLPKDPRYRAVIVHAIRILERSPGWDHLSKVKAINRLVQVYNNMAPFNYYSKALDQAIPTHKARGNVIRTLSRQAVFNKGLKYIPSLFRNHWNRTKK